MGQSLIHTMNTTLQTIISASLPPLFIGLAVGLIVSIFKSVTSFKARFILFSKKNS